MTAREPTVFLMSGSTFQVKVMLGYKFSASGSRNEEEEWKVVAMVRSRWRRREKEQWDKKKTLIFDI
jgi:hypothetical protein